MRDGQDRLIGAALSPARRLDPPEPDVVAVLARLQARQDERRHSSLLPPYTRRTVLAIVAGLLVAATAAAAFTGLIPVGSSPERDGTDARSGSAESAVSDSEPSITGAPSQAGDRRITLSGDRDEAQAVATVVDRSYDDLAEAIGAGVAATDLRAGGTLYAASKSKALTRACELMSAAARKETVNYVRRSAGLSRVDWTCEKAMGILLRRTGQAGRLDSIRRAKVVGVNAVGDRATASVRFGGPKGRIVPISFVREDGEWKLGSAPSPAAGD